MIVPPSDTTSSFEAFRVNSFHSAWHAQPIRATNVSMIPSAAAHSAVVEPPAIAYETLTHEL
jgi:hypothetical protein